MKQKKLSWKPQRSGNSYCSPACGHGCKWDEYQAAGRAAEALVARLSLRWKPIVWENLGWHFCAELTLPKKLRGLFDGIRIYPNHGNGEEYWASYGTSQGLGKTPRAALQKLTAALRTQADQIDNVLAIIYKADRA